MRLRIGSAIYMFGGVVVVGILATIIIGLVAGNQIRVGGPLYGQISQGKELVADILPPPQYVIEAYLEATLALNRAKPVAESRNRLKQLRDQYDERYKYWAASDLDSKIKTKLVNASHAHALQFWQAVDQELLPALQRDDKAAAGEAYNKVTRAYQDHRAVIDAIVADAEIMNNAVEVEADRQGRIALAWVLGTAVTLLIVVFAGIAAIGKGVVAPIRRLTNGMRQIADGDFDVVLPGLGRKDEIGEIAEAVETFKVKVREKARLEAEALAEQERRKRAENEAKAAEEAQAAEAQAAVVHALAAGLGRLADGDLAFRLDASFPPAYAQVRDDFNRTIKQLEDTIRAIANATREVAGTAAEISTSTTDLSQRTEEQAASLEEISASMQEMSATVKKNAQSTQQADQFTTGTREVADRGGAVVAQAVDAMARIEESSRKISDIIGVIDEIARQTNLLALNAAVEAARAGEAGRGFAVVASEVRSLAQRSSQAAKDIKDLITSSSGQVQEGVDLVNRAGGSLTEIVDSIKRVSEIVSEIAAASVEQSAGLDQMNTALGQMDEATQQNSALVEENAAAAKTLEQQSQAMDDQVRVFQLGAARSVDGGASAAVSTRSMAAA
jgi:methyl-accepting chemotaxis protein